MAASAYIPQLFFFKNEALREKYANLEFFLVCILYFPEFGPEKTTYLDTFQSVRPFLKSFKKYLFFKEKPNILLLGI